MKVILLASFLIEFLLRQAVINSVTGRSKLSCILIRNQIHGPSFRRRIKENKPNYGYDPYWPGGEWVFSRHATTAKGHTAPCTPMLCQKVYKEFGEVCGRNINDTYKTFSDYCEMQDADCNEEKPMKWMVAYRGKCAGDLKTFPTKHAHMATRAEEYIKKFNESLTTTRTHFQEHSDEHKHGGYNPTHGHEPYWEDGDWVFMEQKPKPNATTTRKPTLVCGDVCPYIYREVKHVCARLSNNLVFGGCTSDDCRGNWIDDLTSGFHTFDTYCDFLNAQCRSPFTDKWMFLHSGKCITKVSEYLKPISVGQQLLSRVTHYYTELSKAWASHSLPPIEFS